MARIRPARNDGSSNDDGGESTPPPPPARARRSKGDGKQQEHTSAAASEARITAHQDRLRHQGSPGQAARFTVSQSDVIAELRKVQWPTRPQLIQSTAVVILVVAIVTVYLDIVDTIVSRIVHAIF